mmetsp:Transcript_25100/g.35043  ORF Transcript_25100/g.35043 Transcript_25100/m.35043 type:complete len:106 (-) Transcript_25100:220-537(-)|eukprot:CAMPEP_0185263150 /NCGR_PEP_ID=MMETSP1359-20130426/12127_1 /TAXON_ID=552665 /ORGANISM="Bigelowiella longifila, Strain CCMP242" /LENGTH=105 /DNA_ID=CAMNT_0027850333 /DNA_START=223 /DNA_END=540 /DNA_ORIENTATION=+
MDFAHLALDTHFSKKDDQTAAEAYIVKLCGGKPDILGGYFGTLLPCVCVDGKPVKSEGIGKGDSLHFYLQAAISPPFDMNDEKGIVSCKPLDERIKSLAKMVSKL